jgi:hypothetical protein
MRIVVSAFLLSCCFTVGATAQRTVLTSPTTFYVDCQNGSDDANNGLSISAPLRTNAKTISDLATVYDLQSDVVVQLTPRSCYDSIVAKRTVGPGGITFLGDETNPASTSISAPGNSAITVAGISAGWAFRGLKISGGIGLFVARSLQVSWQKMDFGVADLFQIGIAQNANAWSTGDYTVSGGSQWHITVQDSAWSNICASYMTFLNAPHFTGQFAFTHGAGSQLAYCSPRYTGVVTGQKYRADLGGQIDANGDCNLIPGDVAGSPSPGSLGSSAGFCN